MKLIWMTDPHLLPNGRTLLGYSGEKRLRLAVERIAEFHSDADYCVVSGDLVDEGDVASYQLFNDIMSSCPVPALTIPGNHDNRSAMRSQCAFPDNCHAEFIQYSIVKDGYRLVMLDTLNEGSAEGLLCEERLRWLDDELARQPELSTSVFCHHPPGKLFLPAQDQNQSDYGHKLLDKLCAAPNVKHLFFGHVHRPVSGHFNGLGFTALQSIALQAPLPYPSWDWDTFVPADEPPAFAIVHLTTDSVVVHFCPFCKATDFLL